MKAVAVKYQPEMTLGDARTLYFASNNFGRDGGYGDRWVKMKLGPVPFAFPNTEGRLRAVKLHDLHHILTEYETTWRGETEIGAWEIATGCRRYYEGWYLDLMALAIGLVINPRGVYRAFMRGRRSSNLYFREFGEDLLARRVGEMRGQLCLDTEPCGDAGIRDRLSFVAWAVLSVLTYFGTLAAFATPLLILGWLLLLRGVI